MNCGTKNTFNVQVQYMMQHHANPEFAFLYYTLKYGKFRTQYYHTLLRLML